MRPELGASDADVGCTPTNDPTDDVVVEDVFDGDMSAGAVAVVVVVVVVVVDVFVAPPLATRESNVSR